MSAAQSAYRPALNFALAQRWPVVIGAMVLTVLCGWLATRMGTEFIHSRSSA